MSLVYFDELIARRRRARGPYSVGAAVAVEADAARVGILSPAQSLALMIATGIGLHNFSEGLAIGQSAAWGEISLALMLVIGFGLHNATEGFGIVGPFATSESVRRGLSAARRPDWRGTDVLRHAPRRLGLILGLVLGFGTDFVLVAAGA